MYSKARYVTKSYQAKYAQIAFHSSSALRICPLKAVLSRGVALRLDGLGVLCPESFKAVSLNSDCISQERPNLACFQLWKRKLN